MAASRVSWWQSLSSQWKDWAALANQLVYNPQCLVCESPIATPQQLLCQTHWLDLPETGYAGWHANPMQAQLALQTRCSDAWAWLIYYQESAGQWLVHHAKYDNQPWVAFELGRAIAQSLHAQGFKPNADMIVPMPIHPKRLKTRGYNQTERLARGMASIWQLPVIEDALLRSQFVGSQTKLGRAQRLVNVQSQFAAGSPEMVAGKRVLLVDDVVTTGATISAAAEALWQLPIAGLEIGALATGIGV